MKRRLLLISLCMLSIFTACIKEKQTGADLKIGDILPDFEVVMNDGSVVTDEILKDKVSVVMFFHTTCPDCQQALPRMQQIYDEYTSKVVLFTLISREQGKDDIESYFKENGLNMPFSAQNDRKVYEKFAKTRIPRIYINEKGGIIRHIFTDDPVPSYDELKSSLESVIR
ncbi:MAG: TlpA family protein disulfide reductase [Bacteroidales bacterium]|nr:TlpA family protein disulfide reductase [Bacteroidales bacterium]